MTGARLDCGNRPKLARLLLPIRVRPAAYPCQRPSQQVPDKREGGGRRPWWFQGVLQDSRIAMRGLLRSPGFTLVVIATLAIGIGINAAVFTLTDAFLFKGFPSVADNDRIAYIATRDAVCCVSYPDFRDWRAEAASFEDLAVVHGVRMALSDARAAAESFDATEVSANTFRLVGQSPLLGRDFVATDELPGADPVAILSYGFWQRRYARDPSIVGQTIRLDDVPTAVIGVMPEGFSFPQKQALWIPLVPTPAVERRDARELWFAFGRLRPGVTLAAADTEIETIGRRLADAYPLTNRDSPPEVLSFHEFFVGSEESVVYASMLGAVGFVLLIVCANVANLMLARAVGRSREMSVRVALGAGRWRILRQLLAESLILASFGGVCGWWLARWAVRAYALAERGPGWSSWRVLDYSMDYRVLAFVAVISVATGLLFGLAPAARLGRLDVIASLKDGARGAVGGRRGKRLTSWLVMGQVALAVVLLAGAGMMVQSLRNISATGTGVDANNVLAAYLSLPSSRYPDAAARSDFHERLRARLESSPAVISVALASDLPTWGSRRLVFELDGEPLEDAALRPRLGTLTVSPGYFRTLGSPLLAGREFRAADRASAGSVAVVNERFASRYWPGESAIGQRLRVLEGATSSPWLRVVGVASNIVQNDRTRQEVEPLLYLPYAQRPAAGAWVVVRTQIPPENLMSRLRAEVQGLDPDLPIRFGPYTLTERIAEVNRSLELYGLLFTVFATIALLLAALGLYATIAHSVGQQTREIGVRMTVGATAGDIVRLVLRQGLVPIAVGLGIGLGASFALTRVLEGQLVDVSPADPSAYLAATLILLGAASLGCLIPARSAIRIDPVIALRNE